MSSSNSHSSVFSNSSISSLSINNLCEIEDECLQTEFEATHGGHVDEYSDEEKAYLDEPIADEMWLEEYQRKQEEDNERMRKLELRFKRNKPVMSW